MFHKCKSYSKNNSYNILLTILEICDKIQRNKVLVLFLTPKIDRVTWYLCTAKSYMRCIQTTIICQQPRLHTHTHKQTSKQTEIPQIQTEDILVSCSAWWLLFFLSLSFLQGVTQYGTSVYGWMQYIFSQTLWVKLLPFIHMYFSYSCVNLCKINLL